MIQGQLARSEKEGAANSNGEDPASLFYHGQANIAIATGLDFSSIHPSLHGIGQRIVLFLQCWVGDCLVSAVLCSES